MNRILIIQHRILSINICPLDYATVLTGQGVSTAATGRFYFRKKTLQYSFLFGDQLGWPGQLSFLDGDLNILEDFNLSQTSLQNQTDKLCGAWERLPRKYRRLLRSQEMFVRKIFDQKYFQINLVSTHLQHFQTKERINGAFLINLVTV